MQPYYQDDEVVLYHADLREIPDIGPMACVVTSPPDSSGVRYDVHDDAVADGDHRDLAARAAGLMASSLWAERGRAWVNIGVTQLHTWLDVLEAAGFGGATTVAWEYDLSTADTAWASWQLPSAPTSATASNRSSAPGVSSGDGDSGGFEHGPAVIPLELVARAIGLSRPWSVPSLAPAPPSWTPGN